MSNDLSGTQVFFDGSAAPLLYTASAQVGTVVPFGVAGPLTQVVVRLWRAAVERGVCSRSAATCPALFTRVRARQRAGIRVE